MAGALTSVDRSRPIKTYGRRRHSSVKSTDTTSDAGSEESVEEQEVSSGSSKIKNGTLAIRQPIHKPKPKKVEVHLPGPTPRKPRRTPVPSGNFKRCEDAHIPSPTPKSLSLVAAPTKTHFSFRLPTPDDDNPPLPASATEMPKARRTEAERIRMLKDHPDCGDVEPHRVYCLRCDKWLSLGQRQNYSLGPWEAHRQSCDRKAPCAEDQSVVVDDVGGASIEVIPFVATTGQIVNGTEAERRNILEQDPRAEQVLPNEVLCKKCQKWVNLAAHRRYALGNWNQHQQKCSVAVPNNRVAAAERRMKIVNDPQVKAWTLRTVQCASCYLTITLEQDYGLTKWNEHKAVCSGSPNPNSPQTPGSPGLSAFDGDTVASPPADPSPQKHRKRHRENDDEGDAHPAKNRPRTDAYVQSRDQAPSLLGWFLLPFQTFISGFREGLKRSSG